MSSRHPRLIDGVVDSLLIGSNGNAAIGLVLRVSLKHALGKRWRLTSADRLTKRQISLLLAFCPLGLARR